jgi:trehalose-6-phosphate synthase/HAMP domain-containing protein
MARAKRPLARSFRLGFVIAAIIAVTTGLFALRQVDRERQIDLEDVNRRAHALLQQLAPTVQKSLALPETAAAIALRPHVEGYGRLLGYAVFAADGHLLVAGKAISELVDKLPPAVDQALGAHHEVTLRSRSSGMPIHIAALPLAPDEGGSAGVLVAVHDIAYIDERATERLVEFGFWILMVTLLAVTLVVGATWFTYERPLRRLADWMRRLRVENAPAPPPGLPSAMLHSETDRLAASFRAARSTGRKLSQDRARADHVWTAERLRAHAIGALGEDRQLVVVSNREPYMHQVREGKPHLIVPAGGLVTALDPVLQACGGVWVAHGGGDADRDTADSEGRLTVPPADPRYALRRIWLSKEEEQGYYYGFSNEGLWPLCHLAHERPIFRSEDWEHYCRTNERFADAVLEEIGSGKGVVLVQDYQLALVPRLLKMRRPDLQVGLFWHIPWPNPEAFRICPWGVEILHGMLGADIVGFHLQQYCNNFLDTVDRMIESRLDWDHFSIDLQGHTSLVRPFPISVQNWAERAVPSGEQLDRQVAELKAQYKLEGAYVAVGVDRVDYTKGLPERFRAVGRFLEKYPEHRGHFTLVQLGAPSRTHLRRYRDHMAEIEAIADEINWKYQTPGWKPIHFLVGHHDAKTVHAFLHMASMGIVSSLHDGMNLVAKEYVATQAGKDSVLLLSEFAGAARELSDALIVNPYDTEQFADTIRQGIQMRAAERRARMKRMYEQVETHNIYRWAATFINELAALRTGTHEPRRDRASFEKIA